MSALSELERMTPSGGPDSLVTTLAGAVSLGGLGTKGQRAVAYLSELPVSTIANVARLYTVPAGHIARIEAVYLTNATVGGLTASFYLMADAATTPVASDRFNTTVQAASSTTLVSPSAVLDEGASVWGFASGAGLSALIVVVLVPKPMPGAFAPIMWKGIPTVLTALNGTVPAGYWAREAAGSNIHNPTAGAITLTFKLKRAADPSPITVATQPVSAGTSSNALGGLLITLPLSEGDQMSMSASATGLNMTTLYQLVPITG